MLFDTCGCSTEKVKGAEKEGSRCLSGEEGLGMKTGVAGACGRTVRTTALSG